jgi:hypothetical protein
MGGLEANLYSEYGVDIETDQPVNRILSARNWRSTARMQGQGIISNLEVILSTSSCAVTSLNRNLRMLVNSTGRGRFISTHDRHYEIRMA